MKRSELWRVASVLLLLLGLARTAGAQSAVGAGPLTGTLTDTEPLTGVLSWGPVRVAPGVTVSEAGKDSNVFDEPVDPKDDWVFRAMPDVSVFSRMRLLKVSAYAGSDMNYYHTYESERSIGYQYRGRFDVLLSRVRPFIGVGVRNTRTRPNGEIDTRADMKESELNGGIAFDLSPTSAIYGSVVQFDTEYRDAFEDGVALDTALNRKSRNYSAGLFTALTPLTTINLNWGLTQTLFDEEPLRNTDSYAMGATFDFAPEAAITGQATVSYEYMMADDPLVDAFRGVTANVALMIPVLEVGRFNVGYARSVQYSFEQSEAFFIESDYNLSYTQRLFGEVDAQLFGSYSVFNYGNRVGGSDRDDTLGTVRASFGYNLRNRTRVAANYEVAQRRSTEFAARNYDRTRIYLSWTYAF